jgi:iron(III) transport system ATP-binding protein
VHLRASMEDQFARFHERTRTTMVYITHDQAEAMALADRIAVMERGQILQTATPDVLYREPADETVARFIGDGMIVPVEVLHLGGDGHCDVECFGVRMRMRCAPTQRAGAASACLRVGGLALVARDGAGVAAHVKRAVYKGGYFRLEVGVDHAPLMLHLEVPEPLPAEPGAPVRVGIADGWVIPAAKP